MSFREGMLMLSRDVQSRIINLICFSVLVFMLPCATLVGCARAGDEQEFLTMQRTAGLVGPRSPCAAALA